MSIRIDLTNIIQVTKDKKRFCLLSDVDELIVELDRCYNRIEELETPNPFRPFGALHRRSDD